jgi:hypothetical protein
LDIMGYTKLMDKKGIISSEEYECYTPNIWYTYG